MTYVVDGKSYSIKSNSGSSSQPTIGAAQQVAYNPSNPGLSKVVAGSTFKIFALGFPVIGIIMIIVGPFLYIRSRGRSSDIAKLMQTGQKLQGVIVDIMLDNSHNSGSTGMNVANTRYKIVVAASRSNGSVENYVSDSLSGIAGLAMADFKSHPIPIDVYIDPIDSTKYYVDISEIPNLSAERITSLIGAARATFEQHHSQVQNSSTAQNDMSPGLQNIQATNVPPVTAQAVSPLMYTPQQTCITSQESARDASSNSQSSVYAPNPPSGPKI